MRRPWDFVPRSARHDPPNPRFSTAWCFDGWASGLEVGTNQEHRPYVRNLEPLETSHHGVPESSCHLVSLVQSMDFSRSLTPPPPQFPRALWGKQGAGTPASAATKRATARPAALTKGPASRKSVVRRIDPRARGPARSRAWQNLARGGPTRGRRRP